MTKKNTVLCALVALILTGSAAMTHAANDADESPEAELVRLAALGDAVSVRARLAAGTPVSAQEPVSGATALHNAAAQGHTGVVGVLIEAGAEIDAEDSVGATPLVYAAYQGRDEVVRALLAKGATANHRPRSGPTALVAASMTGRERIVRQLLAAGADPALADANEMTPISAAQLGERAAIAALLDAAAKGDER